MKKLFLTAYILASAIVVMAQPGEPGPVDGGVGLLIAAAGGLIAYKLGWHKKNK